MSEIYIICVEDEPEVLDVIVRDLGFLEEVFPIEVASSAQEARKLIGEIQDQGDRIGLVICDHVMPGETGVELMVQMQNQDFTRDTRKILLTGQAGLDATIQAVNQARLNHYIAKPWDPKNLLAVATEELTRYVIEHEKELLRFMTVLDATRLQEAIRQRGYV